VFDRRQFFNKTPFDSTSGSWFATNPARRQPETYSQQDQQYSRIQVFEYRHEMLFPFNCAVFRAAKNEKLYCRGANGDFSVREETG